MSLDQYSAVYEPDRNSAVNPRLDNDSYQIELNVDESDAPTDNENHFQIVSVQSLNMETEDAEESSKDLESPLDQENQSVEMPTISVEDTKKSPPACDSQLEENHRSAFNKYLESSVKHSYEVEDRIQPASSQGIQEEGNFVVEGNRSNSPEDDVLEKEENSTSEDNQGMK